MQQGNRPLGITYRGDADDVLQCLVAYNRYGGYCVPQSSHYRPAAQKILAGDVWESETIEFMIENAGQGDIVHAGAYFGDFLPALSRACTRDARLWAFEPNPENYRCARITCEINNLSNVVLTNAGLGLQQGSFLMRVSDSNGRALGGASRMVSSTDRYGREQAVEVNISRLDDVLEQDRNVSILQLDVEGFEQFALAGAMETLRRCRPMLILENLPGEEWLSGNIFSLGYRIQGRLHDNTVLVPG
jgi:FkbM family methyltransferase